MGIRCTAQPPSDMHFKGGQEPGSEGDNFVIWNRLIPFTCLCPSCFCHIFLNMLSQAAIFSFRTVKQQQQKRQCLHGPPLAKWPG